MATQSGHDLGYYVRVPTRRAPVARADLPPEPIAELPFVRGSGPRLGRVNVFLFGAGGVIGGLGVFLGLMMLSAFFSMLGGGTSGSFVFALVCGVVVAVGGLTVAVMIARAWRIRPGITLSADEATIRYPGFKRPLVVPRSLVRVVAVDGKPGRMFQNNKRFPIAGPLPEHVFADALDQYRRPPWEPREPDYPLDTTAPTVPSDRWPQDVHPQPAGAQGYLYGNGGTSLHVLRVNAEDVPNLAVIFHDPLKTPSAPIGFQISNRCGFFLGGRKVRGFMARLEVPEEAEAAFSSWGVVRQVTSEDVLEEGLRVPKPLGGWRAAAYVALIVVPLIVRAVFRILR